MKLDLVNPSHAYLFGLIQSDGNFYETSRNRGKVTIELSERDSRILSDISSILDINYSIESRTRNTNFKENYTSTLLRIYDLDFRNQLRELGLMPGKKSKVISPPSCSLSLVDYIRGLIDGDGSLGITSQGLPFISFVTASEEMANFYVNFLYSITGKMKNVNPNTRDGVYNIMVAREDAQEIIRVLYYENCMCIERKYESAQQALSWIRPEGSTRRDFQKKGWSQTEDEYILSHTLQESMDYLCRTAQSIKTRLYRLKCNN